MGQIGATARGGSCRLALTDEDHRGRELFIGWCRAAHCEVSIDRMGNIFARRPGTDATLPPVMFGSHLDTVPTGGKFDGVLGVLAGLEMMRTLDDAKVSTLAPLELAVWTNEEGCRFPPGMLGSAVFAGQASIEFGLSRADRAGKTVGEELARLGYASTTLVGGRPVLAFLELHVEQGPELEETNNAIGIVTGSSAVRLYEVVVHGVDCHIGPMPMARRRNSLVGAARVIIEADRIGRAYGDSRSSCNFIDVRPNVNNVIPGQTRFNVDFRNSDQESMTPMEADFHATIERLSGEMDMKIDVRRYWKHGPVSFDPRLTGLLRKTAGRLGHRHKDLVTIGGHDAINMNDCAPSAMVMVPSQAGLSHNEMEYTAIADCEAGANVLLASVLEIAMQPALLETGSLEKVAG
jgi:N-carbamoyl-L-amino-acid hydrolase